MSKFHNYNNSHFEVIFDVSLAQYIDRRKRLEDKERLRNEREMFIQVF